MAFDSRSLDDYIDVAERITQFYKKYPEGSLQPYDPSLSPYQIVQVQGFDRGGVEAQQTFIVYVAAAYRTPDDTRPGVGVAWEVFPGRTNFTRGSEVMNAETSAWGRAIAALGIATKKGIASRQEIENRQERDGEPGPVPPAPQKQRPPARPKADPVRAKTTGPEHERLRHGAVEPTPDDRPAQRSKRPAGQDEWTDQPANISPVVKARSQAIIMRFGHLEVTDREERLGITAKLAGWPEGKTLNSTDNLSKAQSDRVMDQLLKLTDHEALMALVTKGEKQDA
jgi:hypothetical protein